MRNNKNKNKEKELDFPEEYVPKAERLFEDEKAINAFKVQDVSGYPDDDEDDEENETEFVAKKIRKSQKTAKEYAMYLVSATVCTERGLVEKLKKKGVYSAEEINEALDYVKSFGYVNDLRLAQNTLPKLAERLWGKPRICYYLKSRGISSEVIESLDFSEIDFVFYCRRLAEKNAAKPFPKLMRTLLNAGYTGDEINEALDGREEQEEQEEQEENE